MSAKIQEIPVVFNPTFGNALDKREELESLDSLANELPIGRRYPGLEVWVASENEWYFFKGGVEDTDFVPSEDTLIIVSSEDQFYYKYANQKAKREGQIVYIQEFGTYKMVSSTGELVPFLVNGVINISTLNEAYFRDEFVINPKYVHKPAGQVFYFEDVKAFFFTPNENENTINNLKPLGVIPAEISSKMTGQIFVKDGMMHIVPESGKSIRAFKILRSFRINNSGLQIVTHNFDATPETIDVSAQYATGEQIDLEYYHLTQNVIMFNIPSDLAVEYPITVFIGHTPSIQN